MKFIDNLAEQSDDGSDPSVVAAPAPAPVAAGPTASDVMMMVVGMTPNPNNYTMQDVVNLQKGIPLPSTAKVVPAVDPVAVAAAQAEAAARDAASHPNATPTAETLALPPVTAAPVTAAPVTAAPVVAAPVTAAPVTAAPIVAAPVTAAPVTAAPVTAAPAYDATQALTNRGTTPLADVLSGIYANDPGFFNNPALGIQGGGIGGVYVQPIGYTKPGDVTTASDEGWNADYRRAVRF